MTHKLILAVENGHFQQVKELIEQGCDINIKDNELQRTPLHYAVDRGYTQIVSLLINNGADVNCEDIDGYTPLIEAVLCGRAELACLLIDKGADLNPGYIKYDNTTLLHEAIIADYSDCYNGQNDLITTINLLIEKGLDVNAKDRWGCSPIFNTTREIATILLQNGADVNARNNERNTALHIIEPEDVEQEEDIAFLIENGADVNAKNNLGMTPLQSILHGNCPVKFADLLLRSGAKVNVLSHEGKTPLHYILTNKLYNQKELIQLFFRYGADINIRDSDGKSPLDMAYDNLRDFKYDIKRENWRLLQESIALMKKLGLQTDSESSKYKIITNQSYLKEQTDKLEEVIHILKQKGAR